MKAAILQSSNMGFFPRFFSDLFDSGVKKGWQIKAFLPNSGLNNKRKTENTIIWGFRFNWFIHFYLYKITGLQDIYSFFSTIDLIRKLKKYSPDIIHLHNVNQCDTCFPLLVKFLNDYNKPVVWTFHDTRTFTGRCASFEESQCFKWKHGCGNCPKGGLYISSIFDNSHLEWKLRKKYFNKINNLTIVTPSQWLANYVKQSFFATKNIKVIHNGIDTTSFSKPTGINVVSLSTISSKIILGVATGWQRRKGLDTMIWLSQKLPLDHQIVLVGGVRSDLVASIPDNIICLPRTSSKEELIAIYQRADVFVNPTLADNFPTVNIEALGAGIPVVTFRTGGSAECLEEGCGISVNKGDDEAMLKAILEVTSHPEIYSRENCIKRSKDFSLAQFEKYYELYHELIKQ